MQPVKIEDMGNLQGEWSEGNTHKEKQSWPRKLAYHRKVQLVLMSSTHKAHC